MRKQLAYLLTGSFFLNMHSAQASEKIIFSVSPERNVSQLAKIWIPVLNEIERLSGLELQFNTAPDAAKFNEKLTSGEVDAAFVDPYAYASHLTEQYTALAKPLSTTKENAPLGIVVVHKNTPFKTLDDLANKSFTFGSSESFSASVLPRFHMQATGMAYKASFSRSSMSSALAVTRGLHDAAGIEVSVYNALPKNLKRNLRIVWTSTPSDLCKGMKNHPFVFAINKKLSPLTAQKLQTALLSMKKSERGRNLIKGLGFTSIQPAQNTDWAGLSKLAQRVFRE